MKSPFCAAVSLVVWTSSILTAQAIRLDPYQTTYLYAAYRLDQYAFGRRADGMAPGCQGALTQGVCNIWQFLAYIQKEGYSPDTKTLPGSDNEFWLEDWPDPVEAAGYINKMTIGGVQYWANYDVNKLFKTGSVKQYNSVILDSAAKKIAAAAKELGLRDSNRGVIVAGQAMTGIQQAKTDAWVPKLVSAFYAFNKKIGVNQKIVEQTIKAIDGSDLAYVDLGTSKKAWPGGGIFWEVFLEELSEDGASGVQKRDDATLQDFQALAKLQNVADKVYGAGRRQSC